MAAYPFLVVKELSSQGVIGVKGQYYLGAIIKLINLQTQKLLFKAEGLSNQAEA